jgi:hypothetical protein
MAALREGIARLLQMARAALAAVPDIIKLLFGPQRQWLWVLLPLSFLFFRSLRWAWGSWFSGAGPFSLHGLSSPLAYQSLVPLGALALGLSRRNDIVPMYRELAFLYPATSPKRRGQLWPTLLSCGLLLIGCVSMIDSLTMFSTVLLIVSLVYYLYGPFIWKSLFSALLFLFLMVPPFGIFLKLLIFQLQIGGAVVATQVVSQIYTDTRAQTATILLPQYPLEVSPDLSGVSIFLSTLAFTFWLLLYRRMRFGLAVISLIAAAVISLGITALRIIGIAFIGALNNPLGDILRGINSLPFIGLSLYVSYRFVRWLHTRPRRISEYEADLAMQAQQLGEYNSGPQPFDGVHPDQVVIRPAQLRTPFPVPAEDSPVEEKTEEIVTPSEQEAASETKTDEGKEG